MVIEAIYEDLDAKQALYAQVEPQMKADALLASNTSSIPLAQLGSKLARPGRLVGPALLQSRGQDAVAGWSRHAHRGGDGQPRPRSPVTSTSCR